MLQHAKFLIKIATLFAALCVILIAGSEGVKAQEQEGQWIDGGHISVDGEMFKYGGAGARVGGKRYYANSNGRADSGNCSNYIKDFNQQPPVNFESNNARPNRATLVSRSGSEGNCEIENEETLTLSGAENSNIQFVEMDESTIISVYTDTAHDPVPDYTVSGEYNKTQHEGETRYELSNNDCTSFLNVLSGQTVKITARKDGGILGPDCDKKEYEVGMVNVEDRDGGGRFASEGDEEDGPACRAPGGFGWLICSAINTMSSMIEGLTEGIIQPFLKTQPLERTEINEQGQETETALYSVWSNILTISNVLLVVIFFVFIFSQSLSLNIDSYTVKKALPRLFLAAIGMQLSFYIAGFLVDISNVLGAGVTGIMNAAVGSEHIAIGPGAGFVGDVLIGSGGLLGAAALGVGIYTGGILIGLILLALGVVAVFLTLIFRQVFIVLLVALSPIAFVLWILPNTEKFFKMWWENFIKVLLMYPLIMLLLTSGGLLAIITNSAHATGSQGLDSIIAIAVMAAPLFLIPATFKMAGAGMAAIFGGISKLKKSGEGKALGDPKDPNSFRARHGRRVAGRKANLTSGQRGRALQTVSKPTTALPGKLGGYSARSSGLTSLYMSAGNEQKAMEQDGINKDAVLQQAINRGGGSQEDLERHIEELQRNGEDDKADYIQASRSQLHPYIGKDSSRIAATRNLIESKQLEHKDMEAISNYASTPELAGSLVNEAKYGMRDSRLDMFGYKYNPGNGQVEYDIKEAARGLSEADPEQIVSQKPRALENLENAGDENRDLYNLIPASDRAELQPYGDNVIDYAIRTSDTPDSLRGTFQKATESAKGADAKTTAILNKYAKTPPPMKTDQVATGGQQITGVRPEDTVGGAPVKVVNRQRGGGGNPQPGQPQQGPPPGGAQNPRGGNPPQGGGGNAAGGGGNPQPQNPPNRGVPQPPPPQQQGQPQPPPQPQQPAQQNQPQQGPTLPGEQQRSSGLYVPGQDTTGGGTTPESEDEREEGDQGYL